MAGEVRKPDHEASNPNMMTKIATPFASTQDSNPCSRLTALVLDQSPKELKSYILRVEGIEKAIENLLIVVNLSKRESLDQLQEQPLAYILSQIREMDAFIEGRTKAIESHSIMD